MKTVILHDLDNPGAKYFATLAEALKSAGEGLITGYIVAPDGSVINLRKGKRRSADGKKWIPCF